MKKKQEKRGMQILPPQVGFSTAERILETCQDFINKKQEQQSNDIAKTSVMQHPVTPLECFTEAKEELLGEIISDYEYPRFDSVQHFKLEMSPDDIIRKAQKDYLESDVAEYALYGHTFDPEVGLPIVNIFEKKAQKDHLESEKVDDFINSLDQSVKEMAEKQQGTITMTDYGEMIISIPEKFVDIVRNRIYPANKENLYFADLYDLTVKKKERLFPDSPEIVTILSPFLPEFPKKEAIQATSIITIKTDKGEFIYTNLGWRLAWAIIWALGVATGIIIS